MPTTYTSDIGPALPTSILGPLQVVNASDSASYFRIDPASGAMQAAGSARPTKRLLIPASRTFGVATNTTIDTSMDGRSVAANADAGFLAAPFFIPKDMDLSEPSRVRAIVSAGSDVGGGLVVRFELSTAYAKDGELSLTSESFTYDWVTPTGWALQDLKSVVIVSSGGNTFAGGKFESEDVVGLLIRRLGTAASDTYAQPMIFAPILIFEYTALQL